MNSRLPALAALLFAMAAHADIYRFVDESGGLHFSNVPSDKRYTVFMRQPAERLERRPPAPLRQRAIATLDNPGRARYGAHVAQVAAALRIDAALVHAVVAAESGYNPSARSPKGALGLMQLMPETARRYCVRNPYDPLENLRGGSQYLSDLLRRYNNDTRLALAAYNAGEGAVAQYGNQVPPYAETQAYVPKVLRLYERYRRLPVGPAAPGTPIAGVASPFCGG